MPKFTRTFPASAAFSSLMGVTYATEYGRVGHVAVCTCGWVSRPAGSAGIAGSLWDDHVADVHVLRLAG